MSGTKVFRSGIPFLMIGLLFTFLPIAMGFSMISSLHEGTFTNNGDAVNRNSPTALLGIFEFISIFVLAGLGICGYALFARVEVSTDRIRIFNLFGLRNFDAKWSEITEYKRVPGRLTNCSSQWQIASIFATSLVPNYLDEPSLQMALINHIPHEVIEADQRVAPSNLPLAQGISGKVKNPTDIYGACFSVAWYVIILFIFFAFLNASMNTDTKSSLKFLPMIVLGSFAVLPARLFFGIWRRLINGTYAADETGIRYNDGTNTFGSPWSEIRFIECRKVFNSDDGDSFGPINRTVEQLILVSSKEGIQLDSNMPQFQQIKALALAYAPETALVFANI